MTRDAPHYLRFARAIALVAATGSTIALSGCCPLVPRTFVCDHCACPYGSGRTLSQPILCETLDRTDCCFTPPLGPLAPPSYPS